MTTSTLPSQKEIVLLAIEGDLDAGSEFAVPPDRPLAIGRSAKGLRIPDPMVSIHHARISFNARRGYVIEDLESATGTWVDEELIKGESRPIGVGTILRFGSTTFEVVASNRMQPWMQVVGAIAAGMLLFALLVFVGLAAFSGGPSAPKLAPFGNKPIMLGTESTPSLEVPTDFLRSRGLSIYDVGIKDVTDYDNNGVSEVWIELQGLGEVVVTFGESFSDWIVLGEFPPSCTVGTTLDVQEYFPTVHCPGTDWFKDEKKGSRYELYRQDGAVVFYHPVRSSLLPPMGGEGEPEPKRKRKGKGATEEPPSVSYDTTKIKVGRFTAANRNDLAGFLAFRGVTGPVHYILCENAFPKELRAQVLFADGTVQSMLPGCIGQLRLEGIEGRPVAIALSAEGHEALVDDITAFFAGNPDALFLPPSRRPMFEQLKADPGPLQGGIKLVADSQDVVLALFDPVPDLSRTLESQARQLIETQTGRPAPVARSVTLLRPGNFALDPEGCADLKVTVDDWQSRGWQSFFPFTFMEIVDEGCSPQPKRLLTVKYDAIGSGVYDANPSDVGGLNVRAVVETTTGGQGVEVIRARVSYRDPQAIVVNRDGRRSDQRPDDRAHDREPERGIRKQ